MKLVEKEVVSLRRTVQNSTTNKRSIYKIQQKVQQAEKACSYHVRKSPKKNKRMTIVTAIMPLQLPHPYEAVR